MLVNFGVEESAIPDLTPPIGAVLQCVAPADKNTQNHPQQNQMPQLALCFSHA